MEPEPPRIDPDVRRARTLPARFYHDPAAYRQQVERLFARTWHPLEPAAPLPEGAGAAPAVLLPGALDEPVVLTRAPDGRERCLSNVCTHRGNLICAGPEARANLVCGYHGRRFHLDGRLQHMPGFEGVEAFPGPADHLPGLALGRLGPLRFASLAPAFPFEALAREVRARLHFFGLEDLPPAPTAVRTFTVEAHWALYCDNFLEGFHIPFVHPGLNEALQTGSYRYEAFALANLQTGFAKDGEPAFDLPPGHPDHGRRVAAYYAWLCPLTMLNLYPWGLSLNVVEPLGPGRTRVIFRYYVKHPHLREVGAGADLDRVELEDEAVVEQVQRGVRSRLYDRGRYSPQHEPLVHHAHRLYAGLLGSAP